MVTKETKNKIRVDYEGKLSFKERLQQKLKASNTWIKAGVNVIRFILMLGISYVILYPFFARIAGSFMTKEDVVDATVSLIPKHFTLDIYKYIILEDVASWGSGVVLDDGLFLACDASVQEEVVSRTNASSALLGGEGLFNLSLSGQGIAVLESSVPREELIEINLQNDEVKIDGNMAIAWSKSLQFTVEQSTKSMLGSLASGEGLVNVYRGTGKILMAPVAYGTLMSTSNSSSEPAKTSSDGLVGSVVSSIFG